MQWLIEKLFGIERGFLSREGELSVGFNPPWPGQSVVGAGLWNFVLICLAMGIVIWVYRRDGRSRAVRVSLGCIRALLLLFVIALLNRPVVTLTQSRGEPSVLAVLLDDSASMRVRDAAPDGATSVSRLEAVVGLLNADQQNLIKSLGQVHQVHFFPLGTGADELASASPETLSAIEPTRQATQVARTIRSVIEKLQGQRLAGVVVFTDGRDTPASPLSETLALKDFNVRVYPVLTGSDRTPTNLAIQSMDVQESAFKGDFVRVKTTLRGRGFEPGHTAVVTLKDRRSGKALLGPDGKPVEERIVVNDDNPVEVELNFRADEIGQLELVAEAVKQPGEVDDEDNIRTAAVTVLDSKISVLYVDGYPRWEYRYLKNQMIRDRSVDISCLLTSADPSFRQEGDNPITRFPESIEEMLAYDVVIFGDVDPRQFSDRQLQLVHDFVYKKGGGFGMVAGPRWSPSAFKGTPIESILPVNISRTQSDAWSGTIAQGFRPIVTKDGLASSIFRFYPDRATNEKFLLDNLQLIFWYCKGVTVKPGVGEVYAEHPTETGPDGRKAPILVLGRFGGRTLFSAIDDSWRWRFYTGESVFDTYWVQQLRYLARGKKLGQRRVVLAAERPVYELGDQIKLTVRVLDPQLLQQLPEQLRVDIGEGSGATTQPLLNTTGQVTLLKQDGQNDTYVGSFPADRIGRVSVRLPSIAGGMEAIGHDVLVTVPRLELADPRTDRAAMLRIASATNGQVVELKDATTLPGLIPSAAVVRPIEFSRPVWDAPAGLVLFVLLITTEWVVRKMYGML